MPPTLKEIDLLLPASLDGHGSGDGDLRHHHHRRPDAAGGSAAVGLETLERWTWAYEALAAEARTLGIPAYAIPALPRDRWATPEELRSARGGLELIVSSFLSSGL